MRYVTAIATALVVLMVGISAPAVYAAGDKTGHEMQKMTLDQVPAPVKATLEREAKGGTIGEVTMESKKGKTFYEGQIHQTNGKDRYIHVASDGKVLKRESARKEAKERAKESAAK